MLAATGSFAGLMMVATAGAQEPSTNPPSSEGQGAAGQPTAMAGQLITATAKVDKVDLDKREVTLKDQDNKPFTINVPDSVSRLDNVKAGDRVRVRFYESVAVSLGKPGSMTPGQEKKTTTTERTPGAMPGGTVTQQVTTTAKITKIDTSQDELTIEGPEGKANTIKVDDPSVKSALSHLKVGDKIKTTYTQAMATQVMPARSM
jgi:Cu/Ag efflux protein CusF